MTDALPTSRFPTVTAELITHRTGRTCTDCGKPEWSTHVQWQEEGYGTHHAFEHSCHHYERRVRESPCRYCGKKDTPVRQVPAPVPISDCYCDDCAGKCGDEYMAMFREAQAAGL